VFSFHAAKLRPFALVGAGVLYYQPLQAIQFNRPAPTTSVTTMVFVYGAGIDWRILPHVGLRLQYRGNFHNAPDMTGVYGPPAPETGNGRVYTHTAEPAIGVYYRF
jgi:opacity protein-like surface antigen